MRMPPKPPSCKRGGAGAEKDMQKEIGAARNGRAKNINYNIRKTRVCQNTLFITEDRYIAELSYKVAI